MSYSIESRLFKIEFINSGCINCFKNTFLSSSIKKFEQLSEVVRNEKK